MKISAAWLREWIDTSLDTKALCEKLTMGGLEVESCSAVAQPFSKVVIGEVHTVKKHPEADRLQICDVSIGDANLLTIVCGAKNVKPSMKVALAKVGALLPNDIHIKRSKIRNVFSEGMLCSSAELSLPMEGDGILELPADAPLGQSLWDYLQLSDEIIELGITPNRGDCLSVQGLAREVAALLPCPLTPISIKPETPSLKDQLTVCVQDENACGRYLGRIIRDLDPNIPAPMWLKERLRRGGIRSISLSVDVMNYVMLELGQPMHAFDLDKVAKDITVRLSEKGERITLLDGEVLELNYDTLIIADDKKPLALAGIMGGLDAAVTATTQNIFLESAFFQPTQIARSVQHYKLTSESSYRFERGVDPTLQQLALERATALLLEIAGGKAGPITEFTSENTLPKPCSVLLRRKRVQQILGIQLNNDDIETYLSRLHFKVTSHHEGWEVRVPAYRFDISQEIDLIEELIRLFGYENLPSHGGMRKFLIKDLPPDILTIKNVRNTLTHLGYHETINYSFVDSAMQKMFDPETSPKVLMNPISSEMGVMRTTLWPGLINTLLYNHNRQQPRIRIFEIGLRFIPESRNASHYLQQNVVSGLISGNIYPLQWGLPERIADFYDLKGDIENILKSLNLFSEVTLERSTHQALHPGQTAILRRSGVYLGIIGGVHPNILQDLNISQPIYVFELMCDQLVTKKRPTFMEISKFPEIRRDIAILVDQTIPAHEIQDTIRKMGIPLLKDVTIFDVYQGKGIGLHQKSIALALTLQHPSRTLIDDEVTTFIERVMAELHAKFAAELRG